MTIYEQIEKAVEYIEGNLTDETKLPDAAAMAGMSKRSFQDWFWIITGFRFKEYLVKRRLSKSIELLDNDLRNILDIAIEVGYSSNEAYTRSFKKEFNLTPALYRELRPALQKINRLQLYKEKYMGVIVKELERFSVVTFSALGKRCEERAKIKVNSWLKSNKIRSYRIFGHNIDKNGNQENTPENSGYKFYIASNELDSYEFIEAGKFVVTGIEVDFNLDPSGSSITKGWERLNSMIQEKGYKIKDKARWFEEELIPQHPGNLRLDLYIEIE